MFLSKFFGNKTFNKVVSIILNSKATYIALIILILIQFFLVSIIFLKNKKNKYILERINFIAAGLDSRQKQLDEKINGLQSGLIRLEVQLYRNRYQQERQNKK